jgi:hypothetical protein
MIWRSRDLGRMRTAASSPQGFVGSLLTLSHLVQRCQCTARILCLRSNYRSWGRAQQPGTADQPQGAIGVPSPCLLSRAGTPCAPRQ